MRDGRKKFLIVASGLIAGILGAHFILDPGDSSRPLETPADTENQPPVSQPLAQHLASRPMTAPPGRAELPPRRAPKPAYRPKPAQAPSTGKPADAPKGLVEFEVIDGDGAVHQRGNRFEGNLSDAAGREAVGDGVDRAPNRAGLLLR